MLTSSSSSSRFTPLQWYKARMFFLTFLSYATYTMVRLPASIVKSTLHPENDQDQSTAYAPFNGSDGGTLLGTLDTIFLSFYAIGLIFISGPLGDRVNLRYFLGFGMIGAGIACSLYGLAYSWSIHSYVYFCFVEILAGLMQSTGWPGCVAVMTRWYGRASRGTIMGVWNAHSNIGNITGKLFAQAMLGALGWWAAFVIPGCFCIFVGILQILFLIPHPSDVLSPAEVAKMHETITHEETRQLVLNDDIPSDDVPADDIPMETPPPRPRSHSSYPSISFLQALLVPGVIEFSMCLFFSKLVTYSFTFWLPFYLDKIGYKSTAGYLSTLFDVGGVFGGIIAGYLSDRWGKRGVVSVLFLILTIPALFAYSELASYSIVVNIALMLLCGALVNGPYTLVSSAVAADLGSHPSLKGNPNAMATVTGIIDGTGSIGSAVQGVMIGYINDHAGWSVVFYMLMGMCLISALCLVRVVKHEWFGHGDTHVQMHTNTNTEHDDIMSISGSVPERITTPLLVPVSDQWKHQQTQEQVMG